MALRELTRTLEIPVVGTEVLAKHPYSIAEVYFDARGGPSPGPTFHGLAA